MTSTARHAEASLPDPAPALDTSALRAACTQGDFATATRLLRWGPHGRAGACHPLEPRRLGEFQWLRLVRLPAPEENGARVGALESIISGLAATPRSIALLIGRAPGDEIAIHLGLPQQASLVSWVRAVGAPGVLLEERKGPPPAAAMLAQRGAAGAVLRLTPGQLGHESIAPLQPMLERLLTIPEHGWALLVEARVLPRGDLDQYLESLELCIDAAARFAQTTETRSDIISATVDNPASERVTTWLEAEAEQLRLARALGAWATLMYIGAIEQAPMAMVGGALSGSLPEHEAGVGRWATHLLGVRAGAPEPLSVLSSRDISRLLEPPSRSLPGLEVSEPLPAARREAESTQKLALGKWLGVDAPAELGVEDLIGHAFITGVTGSGKSNSAGRLLLDLWNSHEIPFLVIDPVKADYEELAGLIKDGLVALSARDLRLNALAPWPGFDPRTHLGRVATAFKGSFSMPSPIPYVVTQLFDLVEDRCEYAPLPTLHELRAQLDELVRQLGYSTEIESNIRAALGTRLAVLLAPSRAERLAAVDSEQLIDLLEHPSVIQLSSLGDDEERAFVMTLLALYVAEAASVRGRVSKLCHVTVLEEAHRILPEPRSSGSSEESGDAGSVAAKLITQLLAEIRSHGESMIIVDQSPAAVARDVVRNTNLKIAHRVLDPQDRNVVGGSMGLEEDRCGVIARLDVGQGLVTSRRLLEPQAVAVTELPSAAAEPQAVAPRGRTRACCPEGDDRALGHHLAESSAAQAESAMSLWLAAELVDGDSDEARVVVDAHLVRLSRLRTGTPIPCLAWVGLRGVLISCARLGYLPWNHLDSYLAYAYSSWSESEPPGRLAELIRRNASDLPGPFELCTECEHPCLLRPLGQSGLGGAVVRLRQALESTSADDAVTAATDWARSNFVELLPSLGSTGAYSAMVCGGAHGVAASQRDPNLMFRALEELRAG